MHHLAVVGDRRQQGLSLPVTAKVTRTTWLKDLGTSVFVTVMLRQSNSFSIVSGSASRHVSAAAKHILCVCVGKSQFWYMSRGLVLTIRDWSILPCGAFRRDQISHIKRRDMLALHTSEKENTGRHHRRQNDQLPSRVTAFALKILFPSLSFTFLCVTQ